MRLPKYPAYKECDAPWLGAVPAHWTVKRFKWLIEQNDGGVWGEDPDGESDTLVLRSTEQTVDGEWKFDEPARRKLTTHERHSAILQVGDLLVTKSSGSSLHIGKTTLVDESVAALSCCYSNFMQRIRLSDELLPKLAWYVLNNDLARLQFDLLSNSTTGLANLNGKMISEILLPVGSLEEQASITSFLDRETAKIATLISEQKRLIALLSEKHQATIFHAVTRGLNPDASMKDSGVEWIGEVPSHWEVVRLGSLFQEVHDSGWDGLPILSVSIHDGASDKELDESEMDRKVTRSDDRSKYKEVRPGDLAYNMMRAWQGGFGTVTVHGMVSPAYVVARPTKAFITSHVELLLRTARAVSEIKRHSRGITDFRLRLYWEDFKVIQIAMPPELEQSTISDFVCAESAKVDALASEAERVIALLRERRSALIAAAVTGRIDVRGEPVR